MAYESGRWINSYTGKVIGKNKQKKLRGKGYSWWLNIKNIGEQDKYWKRRYLSGRRKVLKRQTNNKLRQLFKNICSNLDDDNETTQIYLRYGGYKRVFDYAYELD